MKEHKKIDVRSIEKSHKAKGNNDTQQELINLKKKMTQLEKKVNKMNA